MYKIAFDRAAHCLTIEVAGFWEPGDVPAFSDELDAAAREARGWSRTFDALILSADFPVQSNEVADMMTGVMARCIAHCEGRVAILVASQLNKMQVERTLVHPRVRPFLREQDARDWISEGSEGRAQRAAS